MFAIDLWIGIVICIEMATCRRTTRIKKATKRFGYDISDNSEDERDMDESVRNSTSESSEEEEVVESEESEDDSEEEEIAVNEWRFVDGTNDTAPILQFTGQTGWTDDFDTNEATVTDYADCFLPMHLFEQLASWTNSRAQIHAAQEFILHGKAKEWTVVTALEMRRFIGLCFLMGIVRKPSISSYWATEPMMSTPYFSANMPRDRYAEILRFIRFSNPHEVVQGDKSARMKGIDQEVENLCSQWKPDAALSLDESLLLYKGRLHFKQFIRIKRSRFGIKIFIMTDVKGYMIAYVTYYGRDTDLATNEDIEDLSMSEKVVVVLLSRAQMLDKGYVVTLDNWYCSIRLAKYLWRRTTGLRGTCRTARGIPNELQQKRMHPISSAYMRKGEVLAIRFCDKKDVFLLSTVDAAGEIEKQRVLPGGQRIVYDKPSAIDNYNHEMIGVDLCDQLISSISCVRRTHAWFKKLGLHFIQRLLLNSYIRYTQEQEKVKFLEFTKNIVVHLTGVASQSVKGRQRRLAAPLAAAQLDNVHMMQKYPPTQRKENPQRRCIRCKDQGQRRDTRYFCGRCPDNPPLCSNCFSNWAHQ